MKPKNNQTTKLNLRSELKILQSQYPLIRDYLAKYKKSSPQLTPLDMVWNIITDYDDAYNEGLPLPYPDSLYRALSTLANKYSPNH